MTELFSNQFPDQPQHLPRLGVAMRLQLRIQQLPIRSHLELAAIRRHKRDRFDHVLIILQQFIHQAHGPTGVMSDRAVHNFDFQHDPSEI
jgi:hypothetical protein